MVRREKELDIIYRLKCNTLARAAADHVLRQRSFYNARQAGTSPLDAERENGHDEDELVSDTLVDVEMKEGSVLDDKRDEKEEKEKRERERERGIEMEGYADAERECRFVSEEEEGAASTSNQTHIPPPHEEHNKGLIINEKNLRNLGSEVPHVARVPTYRNVTADAQYNGHNLSVYSGNQESVNGKKEANSTKMNGKKSPSYMSGTNSTNNSKGQKPQNPPVKPKKKKDSPDTYIYQSNLSAFEQQQGCFWVEEKERERERGRDGGMNVDLFKYIREEKNTNINRDSNSSSNTSTQCHIQATHSHLKAQPTAEPPSRPSPHSTDNPPNLGTTNSPYAPQDGPNPNKNTSIRRLSDISHPVNITPSKESEVSPIPTYSSWIETQPGRRKSEPSGGGNINIGVRSDSKDAALGDSGIGMGVESTAGRVVFRYGAPLAAKRPAEAARVVAASESVVREVEGRVGNTSVADAPNARHLSQPDKSRPTNAVPRAGRDTGRGRGRGTGRVGPFKPTPARARVQVPVPSPVPVSAHTDSRGKVHPPWSGETDF